MNEFPSQAESDAIFNEAVGEITFAALGTITQDQKEQKSYPYDSIWQDIQTRFPMFAPQALEIQLSLKNGFEQEIKCPKKDIIAIDNALLPFGDPLTTLFLRRMILGKQTPQKEIFDGIKKMKDIFEAHTYIKGKIISLSEIIEAILTKRLSLEKPEETVT